jgi:hypothetical protein
LAGSTNSVCLTLLLSWGRDLNLQQVENQILKARSLRKVGTAVACVSNTAGDEATLPLVESPQIARRCASFFEDALSYEALLRC